MATPLFGNNAAQATMEWDSPEKGVAFSKFKRKCELLFKTYFKSIEEEERVSYILLWLGDEGDEIFRTFTWETAGDEKKPDKVLEKFEKHFQPMASHRLHRYHMMTMKQNNKPIDEFLKEMKSVALKCKFKDTEETEDRMLDQLILGCSTPEAQKLLIGRDENLKLEEAAKIVRAHEATRRHMTTLNKTLTSATVYSVDQDKSQSRSRNTDQQKTHWQNKYEQNPQRSWQSPHRGRTSLRGQQPWRGQSPWQGPPHKETDAEYPQNNTFYQNGRRRRGRGRGSRRRRSWSGNRTSGRMIHSSQEENPDKDPPDVLQNSFEHLTLESITINSVDKENKRSQVFTSLNVHKIESQRIIPLKCKVDTGAEGNILPVTMYRNMFPENLDSHGNPKANALEKSNIILTAYGGSNITHFGKVRLPCSYKDLKFTCTFFIADVPGPTILGLPTCSALGLVTVNCEVTKRVRFQEQNDILYEGQPDYIPSDMPLEQRPPFVDKEHLKRMYPECFDNSETSHKTYHIHRDITVPSVIHGPRRHPLEIRERLKSELDRMEEGNIIAKVTRPTDWVNSIVVREKPDGRLRICLDPTDLNKAIKRDHYPTPTVEEITPKLAKAKIFSKLDAKNGYWNINLDEESSYLTTFNTPYGRYRFLKMPFGLNTSQDVFQQLMDETYAGCQGAAGIADDIQIFGREEVEHDFNLHEAMERTRKAGIKLNYDKCEVKTSSIKFFGNIYTADGVRQDPEKVKAIQAIQAPSNKQELHTFLGFVNYMAPFVKNMTEHTGPLRELMKENVEFIWSPSHQEAFEKLKNLIKDDTILAYYDRTKPVTLQVDASMKGLGATLIQDGRPVAYASKALTATESNYANIERELLAVVFGCQKFHMYLYGRHFRIESDHKPLEQIRKKSLTKAPLRLQKMLMKLQPYNFDLVYKPGKQVIVADALSRMTPVDTDEIPGMEVQIHDLVSITPVRLEQLQRETKEDYTLQLLSRQIAVGWPPSIKSVSTAIRPFWSVRDGISIQNGLIMMGSRIIVPTSARETVLEQIHTGHLGMEKCKLRAKSAVWWPGIYKDIEQKVATCAACQTHQNSQSKEPMIPQETPPRPWHTVGSDLFFWNNMWYLLITDYYSKFPFIRRLHSLTSSAVITAMKGVFSEQGIPESLICDNGSQLISFEIKRFATEYGIDFTTSSPHYPRGHGLVERHVQTVKRLMSKCREDGTDINMAILNLRSTPLNQNTPSPAELLNNRRYRSNLPVRIAPPQNYEQIKEQFERNQTTSTEYYNQHTRTLSDLLPGQHVRVQDPVSRLWQPATVVERAHTPRSYLIEKEDGSQLRRNRQHLRETAEQPVSHRPVDVPEPPGRSLEPAHQPRPPDEQSRPTRANSAGTEFPITRANSAGTEFPITRANSTGTKFPITTSSGRTVKEPKRLISMMD